MGSVPSLELAVASAVGALAQALSAQVAVQALLRPLMDRINPRPGESLAPFLTDRRGESEERLAKLGILAR